MNLLGADIPRVLVGTKCDLEFNRQVSVEEAESVARGWGNIPYIECSAMKNVNISKSVCELVIL